MGFELVGRANNHSQDWGLEGMRETAAGSTKPALPTQVPARLMAWRARPQYFESPAGRIAVVSLASTFRPTSESLPPAGPRRGGRASAPCT